MIEFQFLLRRLLRTPGFTVTALLTLALCMGANLTLFALVDSVLLRGLPFPQPEQLVTVYNSFPRAGLDRDGASLYNYYDRRGRIEAFASMAALRADSALVGPNGAQEREPVLRVSPEFLATLGVTPTLGRAFSDEEMSAPNDRLVILSDQVWRERFQADPEVLGSRLEIDGQSYAVAAVLPANYRYLSSPAQLLLPLSSNSEERGPRAMHFGSVQLIARLRPGASLTAAQAQIDARNVIQERVDPWAADVAAAGFHSVVAPLHADHVASIRPTLLLLQAAGLLLLLIGAVNLMNLSLIRASAQGKEQGVRQALGALPRHVLRQVLGECLLLTLMGAAGGLLIAFGGLQALAQFGVGQLPLGAKMGIDTRTGLVALAGAVLTAVLLALPVVWLHLRSHLGHALQSETRGGTATQTSLRLRHVFIVAQIALAFVLLSGAGLLGLSLQKTLSVAPGFAVSQVGFGQLSLPAERYASAADRQAFVQRLLHATAGLPGLQAVGISTNLPVQGRDSSTDTNAMHIPGYQRPAGTSPMLHYRYGVAGDYYSAMSIALQQGRFLQPADADDGSRVCVVDENFARRYWPNGDALGQQLFEGPDPRPAEEAFTVVGVVSAVKQLELTETQANGAIYFPYRQLAHDRLFVVTRSSQTMLTLAPALRKLLRQLDPALPLDRVQSMQERIDDSLLARRSPVLLAGIFASVALLLAAIGTYGVLSYAVQQRRREIAMRMALGARPRQISGQFLKLGLRLLLAGAAVGVVGAWLAGRAMQQFLFEVPALHPATLLATAAVLGFVAVLACLLPARRAARFAPTEVLSDQ